MKKISLCLIFTCILNLSFSTDINVDDLMAKMSLRDKIAQLCFIATVVNNDTDQKIIEDWKSSQPSCDLSQDHVEQTIKKYRVGGLIFYSQKALPEMLEKLTHHYQQLSEIPLLITLDAENGLTSRLNPEHVVNFPYQMTLGAIKDSQLLYEYGREVGRQLKSIGVHVNYAPVIDVNTNPLNPIIGMRSFGSNREEVACRGIAYMHGLQDEGIIACAKHFPGHGDTSADSHLCLPVLKQSVQQLHDTDLYPFKRLIEEGVMAVMTAHLAVPALENRIDYPASLSKKIVTDLLQDEMNFAGLVITDAMVMKGVSDCAKPGEAELKALQAGNDILLCPANVEIVLDHVEQAVKAGEISQEEIDQKVKKVLYAKKSIMKQHSKIPLKKDLKNFHARFLCDLLNEKAMTVIKHDVSFPQNLQSTLPLLICDDLELKEFKRELRSSLKFQTLSTHLLEAIKAKDDHLLNQASNIIICVTSTTFKSLDDKKAFANWLKEIKAQNKTITLVYFCSPYQMLVNDDIDNIVLAYEKTESAQKAAAKILNGKIEAEGKLPIKLNSF